MSDSLSPPPPAGAGHDHRSSFLSFDDVSEEARASFAQQDDDEEQEVTSPRPTRQVTVQWNGAGQDVQLYASHNRFQEPIELTGDAENGRSAQVDAPIGQDLLYRFLVDGEWETATDAPVMAQDGAEYNTMHVAGAEETASLSSSAQANSVKFAMPEDDDDGNERRPHPAKRRQSSIHWDNQRGKLVISESSEASDPVVGTPIKPSSTRNSQPVTPKLTGLSSGSPRFVSLGAGAAVPGPIAVGSPEDEDGDSGSDEEEKDPAAPEEGSARTKRKNRAHRLKSKQTRALFQSPEKSNLNQSAPAFLTPMNGGQPPASQARSPGAPMGGPVSAQLQALQMVHMQRENEWKQVRRRIDKRSASWSCMS
jgi:hypothetical protein